MAADESEGVCSVGQYIDPDLVIVFSSRFEGTITKSKRFKIPSGKNQKNWLLQYDTSVSKRSELPVVP